MDPILTARYGMLAAAHRVASFGTAAELPAEAVQLAVTHRQHSASLVCKAAGEMQGELFEASR